MLRFFKQMSYVFMIPVMFTLCSCAGGQQKAQSDDAGEADLSSATLETVQNAAPLTRKFNNVVFAEVQSTDTIQKDYPELLEQFETAMISYLRRKNVFTEVDQDTGRVLDGTTLRVEAIIDDMRIASSSARIWGGAFAGSSYMVITIKLVDIATGECLRTETISSHNNAFAAGWTGGGTDKSLPMDMGKIVGEYLYTVVPVKPKFEEAKQIKRTTTTPPIISESKLFVESDPKGARVRILNIRPKFRQGITLDPGSYHIETSKQGYKTRKEWIDLKAGEDRHLEISLEKL